MGNGPDGPYRRPMTRLAGPFAVLALLATAAPAGAATTAATPVPGVPTA